MAVKIGSARIDENGKAMGGKAGDQTGREVSTQNWYLHKKGWLVLRAKDPKVAEAIARNMQYACDNPKIGYDQGQRDTLYNVSRPYAFDCSKVRTACETDCSALVRVCCAYAGVMVTNFRTTNEASVLLKSGAFTELTGDKYTKSSAYLKRGDILVTKTQGHTVVVLSNGSKVEAEPVPADPAGACVEVTGATVNVRSGPGTDYKVLGVVKKGERLIYGDERHPDPAGGGYDWYLVEYLKKGETVPENAWISGKYAKLEK